MKKQAVETLLAILFAVAIMATVGVLLPRSARSQGGVGPHGQPYHDFSQAILTIPINLDPAVTSPVCGKPGVMGIYNGTLYVCVNNVWSRVSLATVTPTATATATATATP